MFQWVVGQYAGARELSISRIHKDISKRVSRKQLNEHPGIAWHACEGFTPGPSD